VLWPSVVTIGISSALAGRAVIRARVAPPASGPLTLQGRTVTVIGEGDERVAFLDGTWWQVSDPSQRINAGARARVVGMEGLRLVIEEVGDDV
jgi:membrane protein implicated in regulation of membrane protease activity